MVLAYRLSYLLSSAENKNNQNSDFFRVTRKGLEALAKDKNIGEAQQHNTPEHKVPISEAYIACTAYELERINYCLVKVDREYLVGSQEVIKKLKKLTLDDEKARVLLSLSWDNLKQSVQASLNNKQPAAAFNKAKIMEKGNEQQILLCIWKELLTHVKVFIDTSVTSSLPSSSAQFKLLTYKSLCTLLPYQLHQNGLVSYLYSIAQYCQSKQLPRLDYLVVKEGTRLPDGVVATDIDAVRDFHAQLEELVSSVKKAEGSFQVEPLDLKFEKKSRAKKASRKQVTFTPLA